MNAIEAHNLSKMYEIYARPSHRLLEFLMMGKKRCHSEFWAIKDVNFTIEKGGAVGVIGPNGCGKSTLLKLISGITAPTEGNIKTGGRIASLIELGMGFHPEFSGRSNVYMNAALMGLSHEEIDEKFESILEFSELKDFIDYPIKTYSSGMQVRLAFSVAIHINPEILLVDEALSVGDALFQHRCLEKIREFNEKGITIVFVSHDLNTLKALCPQTILVEGGKFVEKGETGAVLDHYMELVAKQEAKAIRSATEKDSRFSNSQTGETSGAAKGRRYGSYEAKITQIKMFNDKKEEKNAFVCGDSAILEISLEVQKPIKNLTVGMLIRDSNGVEIYGTNTFHKGIKLENLKPGEKVTASFKQDLPLKAVEYFVTVALHSVDTHYAECFDWWNDALVLTVLPSLSRFSGALDLSSETSIIRNESILENNPSQTQEKPPENPLNVK
jgi:lipopolysaccharide transport system ATP-binding protein